MQFTTSEFHALFDSDVGMMEQILTLPSDPPPTAVHDGTTIVMEFTDSIAMPQMQDAVATYRRGILPICFVVSQKVYAELFRFVLAQNGAPWVTSSGTWNRHSPLCLDPGNSPPFSRFPTRRNFISGGQA
jgi:hypothetical protein